MLKFFIMDCLMPKLDTFVNDVQQTSSLLQMLLPICESK